MAGYALTILLGSFLLFQVQPLEGKYILPWFGGSPAVWTTCMLTFQVLLLAGYAYAHGIATWLRPRTGGMLHLALLAASILLLPIIPSESWKPLGDESPTWRILCLLAAGVGAPYLLLASTSPLVQSWLARTHPGRSPYRLYALSNLGSLGALVSYPFVVEPSLRLGAQAWIWSVAYGVFALLCGYCAVRVCRAATAAESSARPAPVSSRGRKPAALLDEPAVAPVRPPRGDLLLWLVLSACGSVLLLATTNQVCQEVAVVPFLWVLPLALYLLTFILCFDREGWYRRWLFGPLLIAAVAGACAVLHTGAAAKLWVQVVVFASTMFVCLMICHGELVRLKPHPRYLTTFYLLIAAGGALGGVLVTLVAPRVLGGYWEYHLGLVACCVLFLVSLFRDRKGPLSHGRPLWAWIMLVDVLLLLAGNLAIEAAVESAGSLARMRNFYGVLHVSQLTDESNGDYLCLRHGRIKHGFQFVDPAKRGWPTSYYGEESGVGLAVLHHPRRWQSPAPEPADGPAAAEPDRQDQASSPPEPPAASSLYPSGFRIGVIGLGVGTMAAYGEPGDVIRFYEINPDVIRLSEEYFTYRRDSLAEVDVVLGDARVSLERALGVGDPQRFDVLVVDAFSSDAIPMHLLTRECFALYWKHLRPDGILAVHISNRHLDLGPVVRALAAEGGHEAAFFDSGDDDQLGVDSAHWVLVTSNQEFLQERAVHQARTPWPDNAPKPILWTDDFSNLFEVLRD